MSDNVSSINIGFEAKSSVISSIEKEFIFKFIIQNKINFEIIYNKKVTLALLLVQTPKDMEIEFPVLNEELIEGAKVEVVFYFLNNFHKFNSEIMRIYDNKALLKNPEIITKNPQRKFERKSVNDKINVGFKIKGEVVLLDYPQSETNYYPSKPPIEADFFDLKIEKVIERFNTKMSTLVSENKIRMLRNVKQFDYEEQMVVKTGRILYIQNIYADIPQKQIMPGVNILLKSDWIKYERLKHKTQPYLINNVLSKYLSDLAEKEIFSKAIVPILYRNYVVGLIYLVNTIQKREPISLKLLTYAYQFSKLLSYSLRINGYFKEEEINTKYYTVSINDFSPGGLSVIKNDDFYEDKLLLNHNLDVKLDSKGKEFNLLAKVVRKFKNDFYHYGFMFIDITLEDHIKLMELYNSI